MSHSFFVPSSHLSLFVSLPHISYFLTISSYLHHHNVCRFLSLHLVCRFNHQFTYKGVLHPLAVGLIRGGRYTESTAYSIQYVDYHPSLRRCVFLCPLVVGFCPHRMCPFCLVIGSLSHTAH